MPAVMRIAGLRALPEPEPRSGVESKTVRRCSFLIIGNIVGVMEDVWVQVGVVT